MQEFIFSDFYHTLISLK